MPMSVALTSFALTNLSTMSTTTEASSLFSFDLPSAPFSSLPFYANTEYVHPSLSTKTTKFADHPTPTQASCKYKKQEHQRVAVGPRNAR